jgi:preprotein translocase subunit SecB
MSKTPPFSLVGYVYTRSIVIACSEFEREKFKAPELEVVSKLSQEEKNPEFWNIHMSVETPDNIEPGTFPYELAVSLVSRFRCSIPEDISEEDLLLCKKMLYVNGSSMLYSAMRDRILMLTSSGPFRPVMIPTHRFNQEDLDKPESEIPATPPTSA